VTEKTETMRAPIRSATCAVCAHPMRGDIENDLFLADKSPRHIAELVPHLSRRQIARHMKACPLTDAIRKQLFERMCASALLRSAYTEKLKDNGEREGESVANAEV
jgi:hypothetical protein